MDVLELETVALGGAMHALLDAFGAEREIDALMAKRTDEIEAVARKGAAVALTAWSDRTQAALREAARLGELARRLQ